MKLPIIGGVQAEVDIKQEIQALWSDLDQPTIQASFQGC